MGNRGNCLRKHLPLWPVTKDPDGLVTSDAPAVSKPPLTCEKTRSLPRASSLAASRSRDRFDAPVATPPAPKKPISLSPRFVGECAYPDNRQKSTESLADKPNLTSYPRWARKRDVPAVSNRQHWTCQRFTPPTLRKSRSFSPRWHASVLSQSIK